MSNDTFQVVDYEFSPALLAAIVRSEKGMVIDPRQFEDISQLRKRAGLPCTPACNYRWNETLEKIKLVADALEDREILTITGGVAFTDSISDYIIRENVKDNKHIFYTQQLEEFARRDGTLRIYHRIHQDDYEPVKDAFVKIFGEDRVLWKDYDHTIMIKLQPFCYAVKLA